MIERKQIASCEVIKWLSIPDIADLSGRGESTIRRWLRTGFLKGYKIGKTWQVKPEHYKEFEANRANFSD